MLNCEQPIYKSEGLLGLGHKKGGPLPSHLLKVNHVALGLCQIKPVEVHYLIPGGNKVMHKFFFAIGTSINFSKGA